MGRVKRGKGKKKRGGGNKKSPRQRGGDDCEEFSDDDGFEPVDMDTPPRLGIGTRVEVVGELVDEIPEGGCNVGTITGHWKRSDDWPESLVVPYLVRLDNGHSILVPCEEFVKESGMPPLKVDYRIGSRVECKLGENGEWFPGTVIQTHGDWIEKDSCIYTIQFDYGSQRAFWGPRECIRPSNTSSSKKDSGLRFKVGDRVTCKFGPEEDAVMDGTVIKLWYTEKVAFADDYVVPYQIQLDSGDQIYAPADNDDCIMRATSPAPECWICFDSEISGGNIIVRECACRGGNNGFVHVDCLVKLAKAKVEGGDPDPDAGVNPFHQCITCNQPFGEGSHCSAALAKVFYETYKHRDIGDLLNKQATSKYASVLAHNGRRDKALLVLNERISKLRFAIEQARILGVDATDLERDLANFLLDLAELYDDMGSLSEMKTALDESMSIMNDVGGFRPVSKKSGMLLMARYAYETGDKSMALAYFDIANTLGKEIDIGVLFSQGNLNLECGNKELGLEQLSQAVQELTPVYGKDHATVRNANKYIQDIERGAMEKMPTDGLKVIL